MPKHTAKPCSRCKALFRGQGGKCEKCAAIVVSEKDRLRGNANQRGYNYRWKKERGAYLLDHPLCENCKSQGYVVSAQIVDHITPHKGDQELFWDRANWQALCKSCHDTKTAKEDGGFGRQVKSVSRRFSR